MGGGGGDGSSVVVVVVVVVGIVTVSGDGSDAGTGRSSSPSTAGDSAVAIVHVLDLLKRQAAVEMCVGLSSSKHGRVQE